MWSEIISRRPARSRKATYPETDRRTGDPSRRLDRIEARLDEFDAKLEDPYCLVWAAADRLKKLGDYGPDLAVVQQLCDLLQPHSPWREDPGTVQT
jgi:hypothetical protein